MGQSPLEQGPVGVPGSGLPINPGQIPSVALWLRADQGIVFGAMVKPAHPAGGGPASVQPTGTPVVSVQSIEVDIDGLGIVGVATFTWKLNGVIQATGVLTAASVVLGATGVTWNFGAGAYGVTDVYTSVPAVSSWTSIDASATAFVQATAANMPAWIAPGLVLSGWTAGPNNQASVYFMGTPQILASAAAPGFTQPFTAFVVGQCPSNPAGQELMLCNTGISAYCAVTTSAYQVSAGAGITIVATTTKPFVVGAVFNGASSRCPAAGPGNVSAGAGNMNTGLQLGTGAGEFYIGHMPEVAAYSSALTEAQAFAVQASFSARYGT